MCSILLTQVPPERPFMASCKLAFGVIGDGAAGIGKPGGFVKLSHHGMKGASVKGSGEFRRWYTEESRLAVPRT